MFFLLTNCWTTTLRKSKLCASNGLTKAYFLKCILTRRFDGESNLGSSAWKANELTSTPGKNVDNQLNTNMIKELVKNVIKISSPWKSPRKDDLPIIHTYWKYYKAKRSKWDRCKSNCSPNTYKGNWEQPVQLPTYSSPQYRLQDPHWHYQRHLEIKSPWLGHTKRTVGLKEYMGNNPWLTTG